jgi:hypothetical protein
MTRGELYFKATIAFQGNLLPVALLFLFYHFSPNKKQYEHIFQFFFLEL